MGRAIHDAANTPGSTTPSRESGSPEHHKYSTGVPASSMLRPISRMKGGLAHAGAAFQNHQIIGVFQVHDLRKQVLKPSPLLAPAKNG